MSPPAICLTDIDFPHLEIGIRAARRRLELSEMTLVYKDRRLLTALARSTSRILTSDNLVFL
jgi:hypothetical protein